MLDDAADGFEAVAPCDLFALGVGAPGVTDRDFVDAECPRLGVAFLEFDLCELAMISGSMPKRSSLSLGASMASAWRLKALVPHSISVRFRLLSMLLRAVIVRLTIECQK